MESRDALKDIPEGKVLINTIYAYSYNVAQKDELFSEALNTIENGKWTIDNETECMKYLIPDGASIVMACKLLKGKSMPKERIAGWDLFAFEMQRLNEKGERRNEKCRVMFVGSSERVLGLIRERTDKEYSNLEVVTYSPPYKSEFSKEDNQAIINAINVAKPDLLWIGMTAPKQEKWTYSHWKELDIHCHVGTIGAVFDFYAGTVRRAPMWWQEHSLEWLYRLMKEPRRTWRRYLLGNPLFLWNIIKEKYSSL
jgi:N-acetylglucosaminyldiphosphoundecaprenol N-acetyl-beta-D-mannosaminyltransferase